MNSKKDEALTPEQERVIARVRKLMALPLLVMIVGFLTVFGVIAYRLYFKSSSQAKAPLEKILNLPHGAKVISATVSEGKLVITVETGGTTEVLFYDTDSMQPAGRFVIKTP